MMACEGRLISHTRPGITERLVSPGDIPESPIGICIVRMQVWMELFCEPTKRAFDLLIGCPRQDTKHLVRVAHTSGTPVRLLSPFYGPRKLLDFICADRLNKVGSGGTFAGTPNSVP